MVFGIAEVTYASAEGVKVKLPDGNEDTFVAVGRTVTPVVGVGAMLVEAVVGVVVAGPLTGVAVCCGARVAVAAEIGVDAIPVAVG